MRKPLGVIVCFCVLSLPVLAVAKTTVTREYPNSQDTIFNICARIVPELGYKNVLLDRTKGSFTFVGGNKREMEIQIVGKGTDLCSVEISGSAWFSDEPKQIAEKTHGKISEALMKLEAQKTTSATNADNQWRRAFEQGRKVQEGAYEEDRRVEESRPASATSSPKSSTLGRAATDQNGHKSEEDAYLRDVASMVTGMKSVADSNFALCGKYLGLYANYWNSFQEKDFQTEERSRSLDGRYYTPPSREEQVKKKRVVGEWINKKLAGPRDEIAPTLVSLSEDMRSMLRKNSDPPKKYLLLHSKLTGLYGAFSEVCTLVLNPPDAYDAPTSHKKYTETAERLRVQFDRTYQEVTSLIPLVPIKNGAE